MKSLNKVMLIGNLTREPDFREVGKGTPMVNMGLAMNRSVPDGNGDWKDETTFVDVVAWNRGAELARDFFNKGQKIFVEGRLQLDSWEDRETGQARQKLKVVADRVDFADSRPPSSEDGGDREASRRPAQGRNENRSQSRKSSQRQYERAGSR